MAATCCLAWPTPPLLTSRSKHSDCLRVRWDAESDVLLQGRGPISRRELDYSGFGELDEKPKWDGDPLAIALAALGS